MKRCRACLQTKPLSEFNKKSSRRDGLQAECRECNRQRCRQYYAEHRAKHLRVVRQNTKRYIRRNQRFVIEFLQAHTCVDCGEDDIVVLEFDHQGDKDDSISVAVRNGWSPQRLTDEIAKCEVVCANCHRRRTARTFGHYRYVASIASEALSG